MVLILCAVHIYVHARTNDQTGAGRTYEPAQAEALRSGGRLQKGVAHKDAAYESSMESDRSSRTV